MDAYLDTTVDLYKQAALTPDIGLCCANTPVWSLPGLRMPLIMQQMNTIVQNQPLAVCDKTAAALGSLHRDDIFISDSTFFYDGGGCC